MLSKCRSSDALVADSKWWPISKPLHNFTAILKIAIKLAFPFTSNRMVLWCWPSSSKLLLVNQQVPPHLLHTGYCINSLLPLHRAPSFENCTCWTQCTLCFFLQCLLFLTVELSTPWNERQGADDPMQFLEMMDFKSSRSHGFLLLWSHVLVLANIWHPSWCLGWYDISPGSQELSNPVVASLSMFSLGLVMYFPCFRVRSKSWPQFGIKYS